MFSADTLQQALVQDYGRLCTLANKILQDSHLAQDAVQESWLRLNRARPDTTDAEKLRHLLLVTVRHTALNMRRSRRAEPAEDAVFAALPDAGPLPQEKLERSEAVRCLLAAMQALEETDRAILQLQYGQGMTGAQIAAALGLHAATVRQRSRRARQAETITGTGGPDLMKEPLDELLVQACAAQQRADLAALEQLEPANVPMPFVPQVCRTPRRLLKTVIIAAVCAVLATTAYAFWPRVAVILEGSRAYLAVQEAPQNSIPMEQMQLTWLPDGCTVTWDDSTYQEYGAYSCLIDNGKQSKEHQVLGIAQMPLENKVNIQGRGPDDAITEEDKANIEQQIMIVDDIAALTAEQIEDCSVVAWAAGDSYYVASVYRWQDKAEVVEILQGIR